MKHITDHKINGLNDAIEITALGEPGSGGAHTCYEIKLCPPGRDGPQSVVLNFQNKPINSSSDFNGLTTEAILAVALDRQRDFAKGPFACKENTDAYAHLAMALDCLKARTRDRILRGVEGKLQK